MTNVKNKISIGITGTIASGKSTVTNCFKELGYNIFDSDKINHDLLYNDKEVNKLLQLNFKECFNNNILDKNKLSNIIFNNNDYRLILNNIMHPRIIKKLDKYINDNNIAISEVPLLFELGLENKFDIIILVLTNIDIIKDRLLNKGYDINKINNIINIQIDKDKLKAKSNVIFYNNNSKEDLIKEVYKWIKDNI